MKQKSFVRFLCVALVICLATCSFAACSGKKTVKIAINDNGTKTEVEIEVGKKVSDALSKAEITLGEKDECEPKADEKITEDTKEITIKRAAAFKVSLTADGKTTDVNTSAETVQAFLDAQGITLGKDDEVSEKLDAKITDGMKITVKRVTYKEETKTESIDYQTEEKYSSSIAEGSSEVTQQGVNGEKTITYKVKYVDGKEESREKVDEKVTKEAVNEIITYGSASDDSGNDDSDNFDDTDTNDGDSGDNGDNGGKTVVDRQPMPDCDDSGHGLYIVTYSDGSVGYEEY